LKILKRAANIQSFKLLCKYTHSFFSIHSTIFEIYG